MAAWTTIEAEKISETEKAVCLRFATGISSHRDQWIPKSCYQEAMQGNFQVQQIKTWFIHQNRLWSAINVKFSA